MNELLLVIDVGNTNIEMGVFRNDKLLAKWRVSSGSQRTPDECWQSTVFFCGEHNIEQSKIKSAAIASVVPGHTESFRGMCVKHIRKSPLIISTDTCPFLDVRYLTPKAVGADRLCNAFAGYHEVGGPLIIVDFGTAVTLDVVAEDGGYLGGVILPGPLTAARALHQQTAQLPHVSLDFPDTTIGVTSEHSIKSGLTWGYIEMVDGMIERIGKELKNKPRVIATGGLSDTYAEHSSFFTNVNHNLVLDGIRLIFNEFTSLND